jgi:hypothetical protein
MKVGGFNSRVWIMKDGDLVWCIHHIYFLPKQGIIVSTMKDFDIHYVVLVEGEVYTLTSEEVFLNESQALQYQLDILKEDKYTPIK